MTPYLKKLERDILKNLEKMRNPKQQKTVKKVATKKTKPSSILDEIIALDNLIQESCQYSKERSDKFGEVFTPPELIEEMLDKFPQEIWTDKTKTIFDPCAGKGNFHIKALRRLFESLKKQIPDEELRLKNIIENQLLFGELQKNSAQFIAKHFSFGRNLEVNLYFGNVLEMPGNYFDYPYAVRKKKFPKNTL